MKSTKSIVQTSLRLLAGGLLLLPLVIPSGARGAQQTVQPPNKEEKKQERPKETKKVVPRTWTNDEFPSGRVLPLSTPKAEEVQPKPETAPPADPMAEKFEKMTPKERQDLIDTDESTVRDGQETIDELRDNTYKESDDAKRRATTQQIARMEKGISEMRHELEILRRLPPPKPRKKDSQPPASPSTSSSETGAQSAPPPQ